MTYLNPVVNIPNQAHYLEPQSSSQAQEIWAQQPEILAKEKERQDALDLERLVLYNNIIKNSNEIIIEAQQVFLAKEKESVVNTYANTGIPNQTQYQEPQSSTQEQEILTIQQRMMAKEKEILAIKKKLAIEKNNLNEEKKRLADVVHEQVIKKQIRAQTEREKWIEYINGLKTSEILKNQAIESIIKSSIPDKTYQLQILFDWGLRVHKKLIEKWDVLYVLPEDLKTKLLLYATDEPHKVVVTSAMMASGIREVEHTSFLAESSNTEKVEEGIKKKRKMNQTDREEWDKVVETGSMIASSARKATFASSLEELPKLDKRKDNNENNFNSDFLAETDKTAKLVKKTKRKRSQLARKHWDYFNIDDLKNSDTLKNQTIMTIINSIHPSEDEKYNALLQIFKAGLRVDARLIYKWEVMYGLSDQLRTLLLSNATAETDKSAEDTHLIASSHREAEYVFSLEESTKLAKMDDYYENDFMILETDKALQLTGLKASSHRKAEHTSSGLKASSHRKAEHTSSWEETPKLATRDDDNFNGFNSEFLL